MRKKFLALILSCMLMILQCPSLFAKELLLPSGTKIRIKLGNSVSSASNSEGDKVIFIVDEDIKIDDTIVIKEGSKATGIITSLTPGARIGFGGKITVNINSVKAVNGQKISLYGTISEKGQDKSTYSMILAYFCLFFLMMKGADAHIPEGYTVDCRVDRDVILDLSDNFVPVRNLAPMH